MNDKISNGNNSRGGNNGPDVPGNSFSLRKYVDGNGNFIAWVAFSAALTYFVVLCAGIGFMLFRGFVRLIFWPLTRHK